MTNHYESPFRHTLDPNEYVYRKTGVVDGRPKYENAKYVNLMIQFRNNQWEIGHSSKTLLFNSKQGITPPTSGWRSYHNGSEPDKLLYKVPITSPPTVLIIQGDNIPDIAGLYTLTDFIHNGYPLYNSSTG